MILDIYCMNCKEHILQADTDTLKDPLKGHMFKIKPKMEWDIVFTDDSAGLDLACPKCTWSFCEDDKLLYLHPYDDKLRTVRVRYISLALRLRNGKTPAEQAREDAIERHHDQFKVNAGPSPAEPEDNPEDEPEKKSRKTRKKKKKKVKKKTKRKIPKRNKYSNKCKNRGIDNGE